RLRPRNGGGKIVGPVFGGYAHGDAFALLSAGGFDDDLADLLQEGVVAVVEGGQTGTGHRDARLRNEAPCQTLVVATTHRDRRGELGQRFTGDHTAATVDESYLAGLGIEDLDPDSAAHRLVGDDPGVRVEVLDRLGR